MSSVQREFGGAGVKSRPVVCATVGGGEPFSAEDARQLQAALFSRDPLARRLAGNALRLLETLAATRGVGRQG